jgi:glutaredoxin
MKHLLLFLTTVFLSIITLPGWAVKIYECEDEAGHRTFESHCPPGTTLVQEKKYGSPKQETEQEEINVTLYTIPKCAACDEVREFLNLKGINITEKNVNEDIAIQNELKELTDDVRVPLALIGDQKILGYNRSQLQSAIEAAGYIEPTPEGETGEETPGETPESNVETGDEAGAVELTGEEAELTAEKKSEATEKRTNTEAACLQARQRLATYSTPRVRVQKEDGSIVRVTEDQRQEVLERTRARIQEFCKVELSIGE